MYGFIKPDGCKGGERREKKRRNWLTESHLQSEFEVQAPERWGTAWTSCISFLWVVPGIYDDNTTQSSGAVSSFRIKDTSAAIYAHLSTKCTHLLPAASLLFKRSTFHSREVYEEVVSGRQHAKFVKSLPFPESGDGSEVWAGTGRSSFGHSPVPSNVAGYEPWTSPFSSSSTFYPH